MGSITEPVNKSGHEKYYFLNLIFKSGHNSENVKKYEFSS